MDKEMKSQGRREVKGKGIFFTLGIVLLMVPLILLVSFYANTAKTQSEDDSAKIRCDELHYFVEDVKRDLSRAVEIFGRRAAIYAIDYVVTPPGNPLMNYTFGCSDACNIDCNKSSYPKTGAEAAIAELSLCGTLNGTNVTYMVNHTVREWVNRIEMHGGGKNFRVALTLNEIKVVPIDAFRFSIILDNNVDILDDTGICYYRGTSINTVSNSSIIGLEDPLYTLSTEGAIIKYIYECPINFDLATVAGNGTHGSGNGSGTVLFESDITGDKGAYCSTHDVGDTILIMTDGWGNCKDFEWQLCYNASSPEGMHFAGVVDAGPNAGQSFETKCNITIPWIRDTGTLATITGECVYLKNNASVHHILRGVDAGGFNYTCYAISNSSRYAPGCDTTYGDGPCFFDRLDGRYNISEAYSNQSRDYFNNSVIGIETVVDPYELLSHNIAVLQNATWVDYLYWKNVNGSVVCGTCSAYAQSFKLDCQHARKYGVTLGC